MSDAQSGPGAVGARLLATEPGRRQQALRAYLRDEATRSLEADLEALDPKEPLDVLGFDSVAVLEFKNEVEEALGVHVPVMDLVEGVTLEELESSLLAQLARRALRSAGEGRPAAPDDPRARAAERRRALLGAPEAGER